MKKNKNVYDGAEMVPENVENTHKKGKSHTGKYSGGCVLLSAVRLCFLHNQYTAELYIS